MYETNVSIFDKIEFSNKRVLLSILIVGIGSYLSFNYGYEKPGRTIIAFLATLVYFFYKVKSKKIYSSTNDFFVVTILTMIWVDRLLYKIYTGHIDKYMDFTVIEPVFIPISLCVILCLFISGVAVKKHYHYVPIDYYQADDIEWKNDIIQSSKKKKYIAYSSDGAIAAKRKARSMGIEACFVDFMSKDEVEKEKGWQ